MAEYSRLMKGNFTIPSTVVNAYIKLPAIPDTVKWWNYTAGATPTSTWIQKGYWDVQMGQGYAMLDFFDTTTDLTTANIAANGISSLSAGLLQQYGPQQQIVSATAANPAVFTVAANTFGVGDVVTFQGLLNSNGSGMNQMSGMQFTVTAVTSTTFTVDWNASGSNYTALSGTLTGAFVKKVLYPDLYFPGVNYIAAIAATGSSPTPPTTTITTTTTHKYCVGQEVGFAIPNIWGTTALNELPNTVIPASPKYYYVVAVPTFNTFVINADPAFLTGSQVFNPNQPISGIPGQSFPQVKAVGDVNTGGVQISSGSPLYPPPQFLGANGKNVSTINGPAIQGAFVNNTFQGFVFGTACYVAGQVGQQVFYEATLHDYSNP
jgi:hypothetical protein